MSRISAEEVKCRIILDVEPCQPYKEACL